MDRETAPGAIALRKNSRSGDNIIGVVFVCMKLILSNTHQYDGIDENLIK